MFSKNNIKHILILALGFFSCSYAYLVETIILKNNTTANFANTVSVLFGSFAMVLGILLFTLLYKKTKQIRKLYLLSMIINLLSIVLFFNLKNSYIMATCLCLSCGFGVGGFAGGYHFSLVSSNIEKEYQGRVFTFGYALGSLLTYLVTLIPKYAYDHIFASVITAVLIIMTLCLVFKTEKLKIQEKEQFTSSIKAHIITLMIIVFSMATLTAVSQCMIGFYTLKDSNSNWFANTRIYYTIGLVLSGIIYDRKKDIFDIILPISFIYPLMSLVLLKQDIPLIIVSGLSYFFLGFFTTFRALAFISLGNKKKNLIFVSALGLMLERFAEGTFTIIEDKLFDNYIVLISIESGLLAIALGMTMAYLLKKNSSKDENDKIKSIALKNGLSIQEEKVLGLLLKDLSNQEMADKLYVSVNTIRNHVANIYKKTGMKKKELREKYYYGK